MEIDDAPAGARAGLDDDRAYAAIVTPTPQGRDGLWITIPDIGDGQHGPCRLQPIPGVAPTVGDRCLAVRANGRDDWWIVQFDDRDVDASALEARVAALEVSPSFYMRLENDVVGAFPNGVPSKVPMDAVVSDPSGMVDLANDRVTIPKAGIWLFDGGALQVAAQVVGSTYNAAVVSSTSAASLRDLVASNTPRTVHRGTNWMRCTVGDQVSVQFAQNAGVGTNQDADGVVGDFNYLRGVWIGP